MKTKNSQRHIQEEAEALIALGVQQSETPESPPSHKELADFFANSRRFSKQRQAQILAYLDSCPQAYERWIKQVKKAEQLSWTSRVLFTKPYLATICALLLLLCIGLLWRGQAFELDQAINRAYRVAAISDDPEGFQNTMMSLTEALQNEERLLSFSHTGQLSDFSRAFMHGINHDWQVLSQESSAGDRLASVRKEDYQLGRWHTLLWAIAEQNKVMPVDFWQDQLNTLDHLQRHYSRLSEDTKSVEVRAVLIQLDRMQAILQQLAEDREASSLYRQLEKVLSALRYSLTQSYSI